MKNPLKPEHEIVVCGIPFGQNDEKDCLQIARDCGITSVQVYTHWNRFEPAARGEFDWSFYDRQVDLIYNAGLLYVPFVIMGPRYAAPGWWLNSGQHQGLTCLEHHKVCPVKSIWNPAFRFEIIRVLEAFSQHYGSMGVLESIQPGICGDYGEAIFPVTGNWPGFYHTHRGFWCGGEDARQNFKFWAEAKYRKVEQLNAAWRTHLSSFKEVEPFLPHRAPSRTAYFDQVDWYRGCMTEYSEFWLAQCRQVFPNTPVYLCTGGMEEPEHASLFSDQAKAAAKYHSGLRLTNEGNQFFDNFFLTAYTKSACDFYGAYLGLEPVGPMTDNGVVARMFGSAAYGNRQIFHYYDNLFKPGGSTAAKAVKEYAGLIQERPFGEAVAFFWPGYFTALDLSKYQPIHEAISFVRKFCNCLPVNEQMILDGALEKYNLLIIPFACFSKSEVLKKIAVWVESGGVVFAAGRVTDLELENIPEFDIIFGITSLSEEAIGHNVQHVSEDNLFPRFSVFKQFYSGTAWMNLDPGTILLTATTEGKEAGFDAEVHKVSTTFYHPSGAGLGIFYCGRIEFKEDSEAIWQDQGMYKALLQDVLANFSKSTDLTPGSDEIARAQIDGALYALKPGKIVKIKSNPS